MTVSLSQLAVLVLIAVAGWLGSKWLFQKDTEAENMRRAAAKLAGTLQKYGLVQIPQFLVDLSVGDKSGMAMKIKYLADLFMAGEDSVLKEFDQVFDRVLVEKLKSEAGRALIAAKLADAAKSADPAVVQTAPAPAVAVKA